MRSYILEIEGPEFYFFVPILGIKDTIAIQCTWVVVEALSQSNFDILIENFKRIPSSHRLLFRKLILQKIALLHHKTAVEEKFMLNCESLNHREIADLLKKVKGEKCVTG